MPKTDRLSGCNDWINLSFVEQERIPRQLMELGYSTPACESQIANSGSIFVQCCYFHTRFLGVRYVDPDDFL